MSHNLTQKTLSVTATIASGASLSDAVDLEGFDPVGVLMPADWTAADMSFQVSADGVTFGDLYFFNQFSLSELIESLPIASMAFPLNPEDFLGARYIKVRSGTTGVPVAQGAARSITILCKREV